jgi:ABC-type lipoprotein release transport system permease subunit
MTPGRLAFRSLVHFRSTNLAVIAGVAAAVAVLAGALGVGDAVRGSLRRLVLDRLANVDHAIVSDRPFREALAGDLAASPEFARSFSAAAPVLSMRGVVVAERSRLRAQDVNVYGVDDRFWRLQGVAGVAGPEGRDALAGATLAAELGIAPGDALLVRVEREQQTPRESLYGRREQAGRTLRLDCRRVLGTGELGEFALSATQGAVRSIFVPLRRLQRDLDLAGKANTILFSDAAGTGAADGRPALAGMLRSAAALEDLGARLRAVEARKAIVVESDRILLDDALLEAAAGTARDLGMTATRVYAYLANAITAGGKEVPYSVVAAVEPSADFPFLEGNGPDSIWLNSWAAEDLQARAGDRVRLDYFYGLPEGRLATRSADLRVAGTVPLAGAADDATLTPEFPGITEAENVRDWDPPFPVDLNRIRPKDEAYWRERRATPKAFIRLERGQELWQTRFGHVTSVRLKATEGRPLDAALAEVRARLRARLDPEQAGISIQAVKAAGLEASRGTTDFGEYFLYFSFFLIAAAVLLAALFFRLGVEGRVREIGTLRAVGFSQAAIRRVFLIEAAGLAAIGSLLGVAGSLGFAGLLVTGLRTWWIGAVGTSLIALHPTGSSLGIGFAAGIAMALAAAAWTLRGLGASSPRSLLSGVLEPPHRRARRARVLRIFAPAAAAGAAVLVGAALAGRIPAAAGFFGSGVLLLASLLAGAALLLRREHPPALAGGASLLALRFGLRNATFRPGRSLLCAALIASATFIIVSIEAFRHDPRDRSLDPRGGMGGYALFARAVVPLVHDLNSAAGQEGAGLSSQEAAALAGARFTPFRVRAGDDTSCLNLFAPREPRILGAPSAFLAAGRFSFSSSLAGAGAAEARRNPWLLLEQRDPAGAVPAAADANTLEYVLHRKLGDEITVTGSGGRPVRLRLVAALRDSIFQGELVVSEASFLRAFPDEEGFAFLLIEAPPERIETVTRALEEGLADFGVDVGSTLERLAEFHRVENTYLSTFQSLGGLGLVLGTVGLATVLLRNVLERRSELALLRAVGYRRAALSAMILAENLVLLAVGLGSGVLAALVAILPAMRTRGLPPSVLSVGVLLGIVLLVGLASSALAVAAAFRQPLVPALRNE